MPTQVVRTTVVAIAIIVAATLAAMVVVTRPAQGQTAGIQVAQSPGATVEFSNAKAETRTLTTSCDGVSADAFAISGGWSVQGTAPFAVVDSFPSQLPAPGFGSGVWTLTVKKLGKGSLTVTPYVSCLAGATQVPQ
jgi:hypothetical protein